MGMLMNIQEQPFAAKTEEIDLVGAPYIFQHQGRQEGLPVLSGRLRPRR